MRAAEDADADVEAEVRVSHAVNGYGAVSVAAAVAVTVQELDTAGVAVSPTGLTVPEGGLTRDTYTVVLESEPAGTVTVAATVPAGTDVAVSPESLTFTAAGTTGASRGRAWRCERRRTPTRWRTRW